MTRIMLWITKAVRLLTEISEDVNSAYADDAHNLLTELKEATNVRRKNS